MPPNDPKLSDRGVRRGTCPVGGKAAVEAGAVTHGAVRCSAWLGHGSFEWSNRQKRTLLPSTVPVVSKLLKMNRAPPVDKVISGFG